MCFDLLHILHLDHFSVQKIKTEILNVNGCSYKMPVILFRFLTTLIFSRNIIQKYSNTKLHYNPAIGS